jgi:hypothetical protein
VALKEAPDRAETLRVISDQRRVAERTAVLARALDVTPDLDTISEEIANRARLTDPQDRRAVMALVGHVVDEPAHTDSLWGWIVGMSTLSDEGEIDLIATLDALQPYTRSDELLDRTAITIRLAINTM